MKHRYAVLALLAITAFRDTAEAQSYCSPTFLNGCVLWRNQAVSIGTIDWTIGATDCAISDYTNLGTTINAGEATPMSVVSGNWCGCAVWVDLNEDLAFDATENLYFSYVGGDPSYTYDFDLTIPAGTPNGSYRMRVIAPWGSDGFSDTNINGYGPCGDFQYGNFDDFTLNVGGIDGVTDLTSTQRAVMASPNPATGLVLLETNMATPLERVIVRGMDGRTIQEVSINSTTNKVWLDLAMVAEGVYVVQCISDGASHTLSVVKE